MKRSAQGFGKPQLQEIATINGNGANIGGFEVKKPGSTPHPFLAQKSNGPGR